MPGTSTGLIAGLLEAMPLPGLIATPSGSILAMNALWGDTFSSCPTTASASRPCILSLSSHLVDLGLSQEQVNTWGMLDTKHSALPSATSPITLTRFPFSLSCQLINAEEASLLLILASPHAQGDHNVETTIERSQEVIRTQNRLLSLQRAEMERLRSALEVASSAGSQFMRGMGHEYRTPLSSILGFLELALLHPLEEETRQHLLQARDAAVELLTIVTDVIDFADLDAGTIVLQSREFSPESLITRVVALVNRRASEKKLQVVTQVAPSVPAVIVADELRFGQVLLNTLLFIVEHATPRGGLVTYVDMDDADSAGRETMMPLRISLAYWDDTVSDAEVNLMFSPLSIASDDYVSSGNLARLRLSLVGRLLDRMGGGVKVHHIPHCGVRLDITLWVKGPELTPPIESNQPYPIMSLRPIRVLIAEDNAINARVMAHMLDHYNASLIMVQTGLDALKTFEQDPEGFDLILMDCQMPELDGFEATRAIRLLEAGRESRTPIIAMTAYALPGDREACLSAGMDDYLAKPISPQQLAETIGRYCRGANQDQE